MEAGEFLVGGDVERLDEELVAAFRILGRVDLHGLEQHCMWARGSGDLSHVTISRAGRGHGLLTGNLDILAGLDATGVGANAVSGRRTLLGV